ncbi:hypothetical protein TASIC1_0012025100 [Trichoderma asperellum]|uniref:F-box domain-containing protein n=1 Tax=Trichoderma asperellum TaxID=101201 RepID=A0A6V8R8B8_TRIAP|nr:hypothetical protein TASIC1_0012025100 [Trichoderma asperellum]
MASLLALPQELTLQVLQLLQVGDLFRLSATCKHFRAQLVPRLFQTIRLTSDERVARSALGAVEAHGQYTTRIEFKAHCGPNDEITVPALPPAAAKVLQGHFTPNLSTVSLKFDFDFDDGEEWDARLPDDFEAISIYVFRNEETEEYVREREETWQWRALMNETWRALAANMHVRELILDDFIPKWTSTFRTEEFRQFLSRLETATFDILGMDNGVCWRTSTEPGYTNFLSDLDASFFRHMTGLKYLSINTSDHLGLEGMCHSPLALKPEHLPLLESLKLRRCFIGPELVSFIRGHTQFLKSLDIRDCVSGGHAYSADNGIYWAEFFDSVFEAKPALTELIAGSSELLREGLLPDYWFDADPEVPVEIYRKLKADPSMRLFRYSNVDTKYGHLSLDLETEEEEFERGNDQKAFDRLIGLVSENAANAKQ